MDDVNPEFGSANSFGSSNADINEQAREKTTSCLCGKRRVISFRCSNPNHATPPLTREAMESWLKEIRNEKSPSEEGPDS